jgi:hypothetical protein
MKTIRYLFTAAFVMVATILATAQDKTDSIKVYYESANASHVANAPEYYIDSVLLKGAFIEMVNPTYIAKIDVVKGSLGVKSKIYITLKKDFSYNFVNLQSLANRFLKSKDTTGVLFTVDGKLVTDAEAIIDEKDILSVTIAADQIISSLPAGKVTVLKVLTKSKLNVNNSNKTYIRRSGHS